MDSITLDSNSQKYNINNSDSNDATEDQILVSLEVIGELNVGDKLIWEKDKSSVNIQAYGPFLGFRRIVNGQTRIITIQNLQNLISKSISMLQDDETNTRLKNALIKANHGLTNLKVTYESDKQIVGSINVLSQDILEIINE